MAGLRIAVSEIGVCALALAVAAVVIPGAALTKVVKVDPEPLPVSAPTLPVAYPSWAVCTDFVLAVPALWFGPWLTLIVKSMVHDELADVGAVRTTGELGAKLTCPVAGSMTVIVNVVFAQAVPALPVPVGETVKTPGSAPAAGQSPAPAIVVVPQAGTRLIEVSVTLPEVSGDVDLLATVSEADRPVAGIDTLAGKPGVTGTDTVAHAGVTAAKNAVVVAAKAAMRPQRMTATYHDAGLTPARGLA